MNLTLLCVMVAIFIFVENDDLSNNNTYIKKDDIYKKEDINIYDEILKTIAKNNSQYNKFNETNYDNSIKIKYIPSKPIKILSKK